MIYTHTKYLLLNNDKMIIFQTVITMTQEMWNGIQANHRSEELNLIEIPQHCTGFVILTEHDQLEIILIKERTRGQGPYRQAMSLKKGLNFTCLCNIRAESPNTRIFIDNKDHIFQLTKNDHIPHLLVLKRKKRGSRICNNISDIAWTLEIITIHYR
jgi:hypothetical protein